MMTELFVTEKVKISELIPNEINPRKIKEAEKRKLWEDCERQPNFIDEAEIVFFSEDEIKEFLS